AVYWVRVPIALATLGLSVLLPRPVGDPRAFDFWGGVLVAGAMSSFLAALVMSQRAEVSIWLALAVFLVSLELTRWYVRRSRRIDEPIIRPGLFADPAF